MTDACEVHDWPTVDLTRRVQDIHRTKPSGVGVHMCGDCFERYGDAPLPQRGWAAMRGDVWVPL